jgi:putative ABC transport system permease protein
MRTLRAWFWRLGELVFRRGRDVELAAELETHHQMYVEDRVRDGATPEQAHRQAVLALGGLEQAKESYRDRRGFPALGAVIQDVRFGLRMFRKNPGFTAVAVLTLALGIGATTIIFSAIDSILIHPLIYKDSDRLMSWVIHDVSRPTQNGRGSFSLPEYMDFAEQNHSFEGMQGIAGIDITYFDGQNTLLFDGSYITPNTFDFVGVGPLVGRALTVDDGRPDAPPVFAMSYRLWSTQFNLDPKILGTTLNLNGIPRTLVGIMPPRFRMMNRDIFIPIEMKHTDILGPNNFPAYFAVRARLKRGVTLKDATADLEVIAKRLSTIYQKDYPMRFSVIASMANDYIIGNFRITLYALLGAVLMLLLIACTNFANLMLARATAREREIAVRASLGASSGRLIRQLLVESFVLAVAASVVGTLFAYIGMQKFAAAIPPGTLSSSTAVRFSLPALWIALGVSTVAILLCGLAPALHAARGNLNERLMGSGKAVGTGSGHGRLRSILVVAEVALSMVLLVGAGMAMRSLFAMQDVDLGFNPTNIMAARVAFPQGRYTTADQKRVFFEQVLTRITALPGVKGAAVTISRPPYGGAGSEITVPGKTHAERWESLIDLGSPRLFSTLGLNFVQGRPLSDEDVNAARHVAVINEQFAKNYFPNEDAVGKTVKFNFLDRLPDAPHEAYFEIVGVVKNIKNQGVKDSTLPQAFVPYTITGAFQRGLLVRTTADPLAMLSSVRREIAAVDSGIPLTNTGSIETFLEQTTYAGPEFSLIMMGATAGVGLILVVIGVFSVMAYSVSLQTHDIGVRMALGAQQGDVLRVVVGQGGRLIGFGILLGLVASFVLARYVSSQFWGVSVTDRFTYLAVVAIVIVTGLMACLLPARRASKVDPLVALRYE